jgi:hypothetical protein
MEILYPETLVALWKYAHREDCGCSLAEIVDAWETIKRRLAAKAAAIFQGRADEKAGDRAKDFLVELLKKPLAAIEAKTTEAFLFRDLRKYLVYKEDPAGYELHQIVREALRELEKSGEVIRDESSKGHGISNLTIFKLATAPERCGTAEDYQHAAGTIPKYRPQSRKGSLEHSKILSPNNACDILLALLKAFNGWVSVLTLFQAVRKHIPADCLFRQIEIGEPEILEGMASTLVEDDEPGVFCESQVEMLIVEKSRSIWQEILRLNGTRLFCLYHLPKHYGKEGDAKPVLKDFGATSTMGDLDKRIENFWRETLEVIAGTRGYDRIGGAVKKAAEAVQTGIFLNLYRRCTENGYDPHLKVYEEL